MAASITRSDAIKGVRGKGLMLAAELDSADLAKLTVAEMLKRHIVINWHQRHVLSLPAAIHSEERACRLRHGGSGRNLH